MARLVHKALDSLARACGYRLVPKKEIKAQYEIDLLRRLLRSFQVDCVIDVGANRGQYRDLLRDSVGYSKLVASVEPVPDLVRLLRQRAAKDPAWVIREAALGPQAGRARFNVMQGDVYSSFLTPNPGAPESFHEANRVVGQVEVEVDTLDNFLATLRNTHAVAKFFLKLDTQGFDLQVLAGAGNVLDQVVALQTEISFKPLYEDMPGWRDTIARLESLGFRISGFSPVAPSAQFPEAVEMNCFLVNSRFL